MCKYVIGDVHGCYNELRQLLNLCAFDPRCDKIIFVGDLVGRGPKSFEVLELVKSLGESAEIILGNHELDLLAMVYGILPVNLNFYDKNLTFESKANDYVELLSSSKLIHVDTSSKFIVVHAGIPPVWDIETCRYYSDLFTSQMIRDPKRTLKTLYSGTSLRFHQAMTNEEILQYAIFGFTKMKFCLSRQQFDHKYQCAPGKQPNYLIPWYELINANMGEKDGYKIIFGHWAALGSFSKKAVICCDTGCIWGGQLTAIKITSSYEVFQVKSTFRPNK